VAIKVLPEAFASDAERLARFDREARTLASAGAGYAGWTAKPAAVRPITRLTIPVAESDVFAGIAISPDGTRVAYAANGRVYLRPLDRLESAAIAGNEVPPMAIARGPMFSPDG
jgi:hypothetical protein